MQRHFRLSECYEMLNGYGSTNRESISNNKLMFESGQARAREQLQTLRESIFNKSNCAMIKK